MNKRFLYRDFKGIENVSQRLKEGEVKSLKELFEAYRKPEGSMKEEGKRPGDEKRNFFAHSGLLRELVMVRKEGRNVLINYSEKYLNEIKKWLMKPE